MNTFKVTQADFDLSTGFCFVQFVNDKLQYTLQACLMEREACKDEDKRRHLVKNKKDLFKKVIDSSDCGFDWGVCGDTNKAAFDAFTQQVCWDFFLKQIKKIGLRIN